MFARRQFLKWTAATAASALATATFAGPALRPAAVPTAGNGFAALEKASGGRLGVSLLDTASGWSTGHRAQERFPMCSTFKFLLAAAVLHAADHQRVSAEQRVPVRAADLLDNSPGTARHVGKHMSVRDLCRATMIFSDNAAANLLLPLVGEPAGLTAFLRANGDTLTRCDRYEPEMNRFALDDPRDTTSPAAMAGNLKRFVLGNVLATASRQ